MNIKNVNYYPIFSFNHKMRKFGNFYYVYKIQSKFLYKSNIEILMN